MSLVVGFSGRVEFNSVYEVKQVFRKSNFLKEKRRLLNILNSSGY